VGRKSNAEIAIERQLVLDVVRDYPEGGTYEAIRAGFAIRNARPIAYATVRRRLDELENENLVERIDTRKRNPLYRLTIRSSNRVDDKISPPASTEIPLSDEAVRLRNLVLRTRSMKIPVTYDHEFLDRYVPGETWYLPREMRSRLGELGTTAFANQPAGTYARDIMGRLIIDLSWGSSRLEGNKYSRIDTEELLQEGREAEGASDRDKQMILNHKAAIEFLVENAQEIAFNRQTVLGLHADDEGRLRSRPIGIGTSVYSPSEVPQVIEERFDQILAKASAIPDPLEQSFFIMVHLPYLQPFMDVNKRTSRLAANISLIKSNICPLSFVDVPEQLYTDGTLAVYEQKNVALLRDVFAWAYQRSCEQFAVLRRAMGDPDPIRLRYRPQLRALVTDMVRDRKWPSDEAIEEWSTKNGVAEADLRAFVTAARAGLRGLRPEILARYSLRLGEFIAWEQEVGKLRGVTKV
jgi:hypothetical protein